MSCQPSLERAGELIQLVNHLLRGSAVPLCGLEARRVVCQCRRRSVFLSISSCFFQRRSLSLRSCRLTRVQICFQLSVTHSAGPGSPFWLPSLSLSLSLSVCLTSCHLRPHFLPLPPSLSLNSFFRSQPRPLSLSLSRPLPGVWPAAHAATAGLSTRTRHFIHDPKILDNRRLHRLICQGRTCAWRCVSTCVCVCVFSYEVHSSDVLFWLQNFFFHN